MILLDTSAAFALFAEEPGADMVADALETEEGALSVVNFAELLELLERSGANTAERFEELRSAFVVVPMTDEDALAVAQLYSTTRRPSLSLADRVALATARRLGVPVFTTERAWADFPEVDVRVIR